MHLNGVEIVWRRKTLKRSTFFQNVFLQNVRQQWILNELMVDIYNRGRDVQSFLVLCMIFNVVLLCDGCGDQLRCQSGRLQVSGVQSLFPRVKRCLNLLELSPGVLGCNLKGMLAACEVKCTWWFSYYP